MDIATALAWEKPPVPGLHGIWLPAPCPSGPRAVLLRPGGGRSLAGTRDVAEDPFREAAKEETPTPRAGEAEEGPGEVHSPRWMPSSNHCCKGEARLLPGCLGPASYSWSSRLCPGPSHLSLRPLSSSPGTPSVPQGLSPFIIAKVEGRMEPLLASAPKGGEGCRWRGACTLTPSTAATDTNFVSVQ